MNRTLAELLAVERPCAGKGKCGKCRVNICELESRLGRKIMLSEPNEIERRMLGGAISNGFRLACQARVLNLDESETLESKPTVENSDVNPPKPRGTVCIDIGTTTLEAVLLTESGEIIRAKPRLNPQRVFGSDVISRIDASDEHFDELSRMLRSEIFELITDFEPTGAVVTGNTVMLHFFAGLSVDGMRADPFVPSSLFGVKLDADSVGLGFHGEIYLPACVSAFVGADTTCALLAAELRSDEHTLLVDLGTNGELAFTRGGRTICCSTAAGPALEGADISCGMRAEAGAICKVSYTGGEFALDVIGGIEPAGLCGSGLISAVAALLDAGIIDESGYLEEPFELSPNVRIEPRDIRSVQLAKGAIAAGIRILCADERVDRLCIAGNFGRGLDIRACRRIGLIPESVADAQIEILGNAALEGAMLIAKGAHEPFDCEYLSLAEDERFAEFFTECMLFCTATAFTLL